MPRAPAGPTRLARRRARRRLAHPCTARSPVASAPSRRCAGGTLRGRWASRSALMLRARPDGPRSRPFGSSLGISAADPPRVHFERLVIEAGDDTFSLDLHHRMTVIAGVGQPRTRGADHRADRRARARALGRPPRDRVRRRRALRHLPPGRRPPPGRRHRRRPADVTDAVHDRRPPRRARAGRASTAAAPAASCACSPTTWSPARGSRSTSLALARIDQGRLWDVADQVKERERRLAETAQAAGSDAEDAVMFEEIERRHRAFEQAQEAHERVRYLSFLVGAGAALVGVCAAVLYGFWLAVPFLMLAIAATVAVDRLLAAGRAGPPRRGGGPARGRRPARTSPSRSTGSTACSPATSPPVDDAGRRGAPGRPRRVAGAGRRHPRRPGPSSTPATSAARPPACASRCRTATRWPSRCRPRTSPRPSWPTRCCSGWSP